MTSDAKFRPLAAIDHLLTAAQHLSDEKNQSEIEKLPQLLGEAVLPYLNVPLRNWRTDPIGGLFDRGLSATSRHFIAACLVRLLSCPDAFRDVGFRNRTYELFDVVLGPIIYSRLKIRDKDQTHQKGAALKGALEDAEVQLTAALSTLTGLKSLPRFEKEFFDAYHKPAAQLFIAPFLPKLKLETSLHSLVSGVSAYSSASPSQVVSCYDAASLAAERLSEEASGSGRSTPRSIS
ncbi:MAG: hypothetical protein ACJ74Z_17165 [Bryobacteraceae bacterium]